MLKRSKSGRAWNYGSSTLISTLFFLGILVFVALIAERHPWRWDLTESKSFTLSEQTRKVLDSIDRPVTIKAFFATAAPEQSKVKDLLDTYRYYNPKITYEFIDPDRHPEVAKRYEIRTYGTLVLEGYDKKQPLPTATEEGLTNGLLRLTRKTDKKLYFLVGHGERSLENVNKEGYSSVDSELRKAGYVPAPLNLMQQFQVPEGASAVFIVGPRKNLLPQEVESLKSYLERGGRVLVFLDPEHDGGLREFLRSHGVELGDDTVIDKLSRVFGGSYLMPVVMEYGEHKITRDFEVATFFPEARSVRPVKDPPANVHVEILASTSANAWAETDLNLLREGQAGFDEGEDIPGPVPLAVISEIELRQGKEGEEEGTSGKEPRDLESDDAADNAADAGKKAYLLVAGDSDFAGNTYFSLSGNGDLFLNMIGFMSEDENLITIKPRQKTGTARLMTPAQSQVMLLTAMVLVPLIVVLSGLMVYRVRRSQR